MVGGGRLDLDVGQQERIGLVQLVGRDIHHVLPRHDRSGLLQDVDHRVRDRDAVDVESVVGLAGRAAGDDRLVKLHALVVRPLRIGRVLEVADARHVLQRGAGGLGQAHVDLRVGDRVEVDGRLPMEERDRDQRLDGESGGREDEQRVSARGLQLRELRGRIGGRHVVALLGHDHRGVRAKTVGQPFQIVLPVVVVLVEDADFRAGVVLQDVLRVDVRLALVRGLPAKRPRVGAEILVEGCGAGGDEQLGNLLAVQVIAHGDLVLRAEAAEHGEDLVVLDELLGQGHRLRGVVRVVEDLEVDLAAVDSALAVHVGEVGELSVADGAVRRGGPRLRDCVAQQDRVAGDPDVGLRSRGRRAATGGQGDEEDRQRGQPRCFWSHRNPSRFNEELFKQSERPAASVQSLDRRPPAACA